MEETLKKEIRPDEIIPERIEEEKPAPSAPTRQELDTSKTVAEKVMRRLLEENEILNIQIRSREREIVEMKKELDELHSSISYRFGRWVAETKVGRALKSFLRKYVVK